MVLEKTGRGHYNRIDCPTFLNTDIIASTCHECFKQNYQPNLDMLTLQNPQEGTVVIYKYDGVGGGDIHLFRSGMNLKKRHKLRLQSFV